MSAGLTARMEDPSSSPMGATNHTIQSIALHQLLVKVMQLDPPKPVATILLSTAVLEPLAGMLYLLSSVPAIRKEGFWLLRLERNGTIRPNTRTLIPLFVLAYIAFSMTTIYCFQKDLKKSSLSTVTITLSLSTYPFMLCTGWTKIWNILRILPLTKYGLITTMRQTNTDSTMTYFRPRTINLLSFIFYLFPFAFAGPAIYLVTLHVIEINKIYDLYNHSFSTILTGSLGPSTVMKLNILALGQIATMERRADGVLFLCRLMSAGYCMNIIVLFFMMLFGYFRIIQAVRYQIRTFRQALQHNLSLTLSVRCLEGDLSDPTKKNGSTNTTDDKDDDEDDQRLKAAPRVVSWKNLFSNWLPSLRDDPDFLQKPRSSTTSSNPQSQQPWEINNRVAIRSQSKALQVYQVNLIWQVVCNTIVMLGLVVMDCLIWTNYLGVPIHHTLSDLNWFTITVANVTWLMTIGIPFGMVTAFSGTSQTQQQRTMEEFINSQPIKLPATNEIPSLEELQSILNQLNQRKTLIDQYITNNKTSKTNNTIIKIKRPTSTSTSTSPLPLPLPSPSPLPSSPSLDNLKHKRKRVSELSSPQAQSPKPTPLQPPLPKLPPPPLPPSLPPPLPQSITSIPLFPPLPPLPPPPLPIIQSQSIHQQQQPQHPQQHPSHQPTPTQIILKAEPLDLSPPLPPERSISPDSLPLALIPPPPPTPPPQPQPTQASQPESNPLQSSSFFASPPSQPPTKPIPRPPRPPPPRLLFGLPTSLPLLPPHPYLSTPKSAITHPLPLSNPPLPPALPPSSSSTTNKSWPTADRAEDFTVPLDPIYTLPLPSSISLPTAYPKTQGEVHQDFSKTKPPSTQVPIHQFQNWINDHYLRSFGEDDLAFLASEYSSINGCPTVRVHLPSSLPMDPEIEPKPEARDETFDLPPLGRHYSEIWRDQDLGIPPRPDPTPPLRRGELPRTSLNDLSIDRLATESISLGPLTERLISALHPSSATRTSPSSPIVASLNPTSSVEDINTLELENRVTEELRLLGILPDASSPECKADHDRHNTDAGAEDDEISRTLRRTQAVLRRQSGRNKARKARLSELVKQRMAVQEFEGIKDGLDRLLFQLFIRKLNLLSSSSTTSSSDSSKKKKSSTELIPSSTLTTDSQSPHSALLASVAHKLKTVDKHISVTLDKRRRFLTAVSPILTRHTFPLPTSINHHLLDDDIQLDHHQIVSKVHNLPQTSIYLNLDLDPLPFGHTNHHLGATDNTHDDHIVGLDLDNRFVV